MSGKDELVFLAKLAEQAERYEEMAEHMKKVAELGSPLSSEDRNLLSVAYKNVIGARRAAWRIVSSLEQKEASKEKSDKIEQTKNYREKIEKELMTICDEIINLLDKTLIPHCDNSENVESSVFFYKMMGDYCRYKAEIADAEARKQACEEAKEAYTKAQEMADTKDKELPNTHPIRLGLALNFSVFHYEIRNDQAKACELAKKAFDDAIAMLDTLDEESYKDSTLIMQLLRDNLNLWASDNDDADKEDIKVDDIEGDD